MNVSMFLCDWAEVVNGKLYAQGIGWTRAPANVPLNIAVALQVRIDYNETNTRHQLEIRLVDSDGHPVPTEENKVVAGFEFEVGRPPGMAHGETQVAVFAAKLNGLVLGPGRYSWDVYRNGDVKIPESCTFTLQ